MSLMKKISEDMTTAMKARDQARLAPLRMVKAALMNREVEKGRELDDTEAQQVVVSLIKQRRDSVEQFLKGGREELAARETAEIATLEAYLPPPVDPADLERAVDDSVSGLYALRFDPTADGFRSDARFAPLLNRYLSPISI